MSQSQAKSVQAAIDSVFRAESRRVLATLIRLLGDFDLAEDALQDAFAAALQSWPSEGIPANPTSWLISTGRFKAIDNLRRKSRFDAAIGQLAEELDNHDDDPAAIFEKTSDGIEDDTLRLIFTCCHPSLSDEAQIALTLREVCGLTTEEIASAFLTATPTIAQRIVRAKSKIHEARIPYVIPSRVDMPERLNSVLHVIYLVFNEGYSASSGETLTRSELSADAIRLTRILAALLPEPEVLGLLALMLIHESRRKTRVSTEGDLILLEDQDRSLWDQALIAEGLALVASALGSQQLGSYTLQAAIAAEHARAVTPAETDWARIVGIYDLLLQSSNSPIVRLNRAVAVAMRDSPEEGLRLIDELIAQGELSSYHLIYAAKADLCRRLGRLTDAGISYKQALSLAKTDPERRFLEKRLAELSRK